MGNRGLEKLRQEIHRNVMVWFFRKYNHLYFKAHQTTGEPFRLGGPLAHLLAASWSTLSVGSSCSRQALSKLVEQMFLGSLFQSLTTRLAMSFHLVLTEVYFAATCDGFLSVLCLLCSLSLGGKTATRFLSAPTNIVFPIYTDPSLIIFSSTACLGPLTVLLERHQFVTGGLKLGLLFHHHCVETLLARSLLPTRTTMTFSSDLLPLGSSGWIANPSAGFYSLTFWVVLVNYFHVSQSSILLQCLWREALLSTISIVPSKLMSFVNWVWLFFIHHLGCGWTATVPLLTL